MTTPTVVADVLRDRVLSLHYGPGTPLREVAIAVELGASRRTVREALISLDREGIVVHERNRGARVRTFTPDEVNDLYSARLALETFGASNVSSADESSVAEVTRAFETLVTSARHDQDGLQHAMDDMAFHASVIALAGSTKLDKIFGELSIEMALAIRVLQHDEVSGAMTPEEVIADHAAIHSAVVGGRPDDAVRAVRVHIAANRDRLVRLVSTE